MVSYRELIAFVWRFMRLQKWTFLFILLLDTAWSLEALIWPYILRVIIDIFTRFDGNRLAAWGALIGPIIGGLSLVIYVEVASRTMGFLMARAVPKLQATIRMAMFDHVQHHSPRYFNRRFAGSVANKLTDMTTQIKSIIRQLYWPIIPALFTCFLGAIFLWFVNPLFSWIMLAWFAIHIAICLKFARSCDVYEYKHGEVRSHLLGKIVDSFTNNFTVNLFYRFKQEKAILSPFQKEEEQTHREARRHVEKMRCVLSVFHFMGVVLGICGSLLYLWVHGRISTGQVIQVFTTIWGIGAILWGVGSALPLLFQSFWDRQASLLRDARPY